MLDVFRIQRTNGGRANSIIDTALVPSHVAPRIPHIDAFHISNTLSIPQSVHQDQFTPQVYTASTHQFQHSILPQKDRVSTPWYPPRPVSHIPTSQRDTSSFNFTDRPQGLAECSFVGLWGCRRFGSVLRRRRSERGV